MPSFELSPPPSHTLPCASRRVPACDFDLEKPKDSKIAEVFQAKGGGKFAALFALDSDVETLANCLKEVLLSTVEEILGSQSEKLQPWTTNEVLDLCD